MRETDAYHTITQEESSEVRTRSAGLMTITVILLQSPLADYSVTLLWLPDTRLSNYLQQAGLARGSCLHNSKTPFQVHGSTIWD